MTDEFLVDASAWVNLLAKVRTLPDRLSASSVVACSFTAGELASLARRKPGTAPMLSLLLSSARLEECQLQDFLAGGDLHGRLRTTGRTKVALGDCLLHAVAQRLGIPLVTSDHDLAGLPEVVLL